MRRHPFLLPHVVSLPVVLDQEVQRMAEAMAANPVYRITNAETAMGILPGERIDPADRTTARSATANHRPSPDFCP